jgi:hypothetical protein
MKAKIITSAEGETFEIECKSFTFEDNGDVCFYDDRRRPIAVARIFNAIKISYDEEK